uniref:C2H2-type domain-containing protein n=1 Tax=Pithovirus LCPAC304 TaxID=2506594 RepID=A0A481Z7F1_9VIRU|nr:MAG: hypothetical protein LCPAC304_01360 [Pithovirus LCPAC304]
MATELQKAWFAGFYEGEGSISNDKANGNRLRLSISQNDPTPLYLAQRIWGGYIRKRTRKSPASDKICIGHEWRLSHHPSLNFLGEIAPYMIIPKKIQQVETAKKNVKKPTEKRYICSFCAKAYIYPSNRRRHERKEHIEKGAVFKCSINECSRTYKSKDSMQRHIRLNHKNSDASDKNNFVARHLVAGNS